MDLTVDQWLAIVAAYGGRCAYCGERPEALDQEHVIPLSMGGGHTASNVVPSCRPCNLKKGSGMPLVPVQLAMAV